MGNVCRNCNRGYEYEADEFVCDVCGAKNHADGSWSVPADREDINEMERHIEDYDDQEYRRTGRNLV